MANLLAEHPTPAQLHSFFEGKLEFDEFASIEEHLSSCAACCRALENVPADSFVGRLKSAERAAFATTADGNSATLHEVTGIPVELADHPRYRVLSLIGQGGMGAVFKAEHRRMERLVALKVINPSLMKNPATVSRFQQEVRATAKLSHPNIVTAHDADQAGGLHFLVMEYVEGKTLADLLNERGSLPIPEACEYVRQAAIGLQHLHEAGLIHRDVKPHNLMRSSSGAVKLLDCGLARFTDESAESLCQSEIRNPQSAIGLTHAGTVMGTADYVAPEQIADARAADIRSDIYSLGCTFYHLLTGKPPFPEGAPTDKFKHHADTPIAIPDEWPAELKATVGKMTAKKPEDRYATPAKVAEALRVLGACSASKGPSAKRERSRGRSLIAAGLLSLAALFVAAVVVIKIQTDKGEITITTDDENIEIITKKGGDIVRIRDPKSGQTWELDTKKLTMRDLEHADGLALEVPWRGKLTFKSSGGKVVVSAGESAPKGKNFLMEDGEFGYLIVKHPYGFQPLFKDVDLAGWEGDKKAWSWKDGMLVGKMRDAQAGGYLVSSKVYKDFEVRFQLRLSGRKDGCFFYVRGAPWVVDKELRAKGPAAIFTYSLRQTGLHDLVYGSFYLQADVGDRTLTEAKREDVEKILKLDYNDLSIRCVGKHVTIRVNGVTLIDQDYPTLPDEGVLAFAAAPGIVRDAEVRFRDIQIRELSNEGKPTEPFQPLFNGKDLDGWKQPSDDGKWLVRNGILLGTANGFVRSNRSYKDFHLRATIRYNKNCQVLLAFRSHPDRGGGTEIGHSNTGSIVLYGREITRPIGPSKAALTKPETWYDLDLIVRGKQVTVKINGEPCAEALVPELPDSGSVSLYANSPGTFIEFTKIEIKELPPTPPEPVFQPLFNGKDLTGWEGDKTVWSWKDGMLHCRSDGNPGGAPLWKSKDVKDFELTFQVRHKEGTGSARVNLRSRVQLVGQKVFVFGPMSQIGGDCWGKFRPEFSDGRLDKGLVEKIQSALKKNEFNDYSIKCVGKHVTIQLNGLTTVDKDFPEIAQEGVIAWGVDGADVEATFRNIQIRDLTDAVQIPKEPALQPPSDGKDRISGPQPNEAVKDFVPLHIAGRHQGKKSSLVEEYGANPTVLIFARGISPGLLSLIGKVDAALVEQKGASLRGAVIFLNESDDLIHDRRLLPLLSDGKLLVPFTCIAESGVADSKIHKDAHVTVVLYANRKVRANFAFDKDNLTETEVAKVLGELRRLQTESKQLNPADALKHSEVPEIAKAFVGRGDPKNVPPELVAVLGDVRFRGLPRSRVLAFSSDGKQIAEASDGLIRILDAQTGRLIRQITSPYVPKKSLQFSQDGNYLLAIFGGDILGVIDAMTGKLLWESSNKVVTYCLDPDGNHVYLSSFDPKEIEKCNLRTGKSVQKWPMSEFARELAIGVEPQWVYVDAVGNVYSGRRDRNEVAVLMKDSEHRGQRVVFSPDGKYFAIARISNPQAKHQIVVYDAGGKQLHVLTGQAKDALAFSPDGTTLTAVNISEKTFVTRWKVTSGEQIASFEFHNVIGDCLATLSPDTKTLARRLVEFPQIELWDTETGKHRYDGMNPQPFVNDFVWSPDSKQFAGFDAVGGYVWDVATGVISFAWANASAVAFSPNGKMIAIAGEDEITLETSDHKPLHKLKGPKVALHRLAFSPDGKLLAAAGWSNNLWVWHTDTGTTAHIFEQGNSAETIVFSLDGRALYSSIRKPFHVKAWDVTTGKQIQFESGEVLAQAMIARPDGKTIAVLDSNAYYRLLDLKTGAGTKPIELPAKLECDGMPGALSPIGDLVALSTRKGSLVLWRPNDKPQRYRLIKLASDHSEQLRAIRFSPDGRYVAAASADGIICVLRIAERGKEPDLPLTADKTAPAVELEVLPAPRERSAVPKLPAIPLVLSAKFPPNLFLVRAKLKEIDRRGTLGAPEKYRFTIVEVFAGDASLKDKIFTYVPTSYLSSSPRPILYDEVQVYFDLTIGTEMLWWLKGPGPNYLPAEFLDESAPLLSLDELRMYALEGFPIAKPGRGLNRSVSWEDALAWARKVETVYRAKTPAERGQMLRRMVVQERPYLVRWAVAMLVNTTSPEVRKELRERAERLNLSVEDALLVDRILSRLANEPYFAAQPLQLDMNTTWLRAEAREALLRFCLHSEDDTEFDRACRRLTDAVHDHEIDFAFFSKVLSEPLDRGAKLSEDKQWSLGRTLLEMRFEMEPQAQVKVDPRKSKPFGLMTPEIRGKAMTWLFDIVGKSTSTVLRDHAAAALKHYGPLSEEEKKKLPFDLGPYPTQDDGTLAYRAAQNFAKDYATQKHVYVVGPFYLGGWLVPRANGWELPIKAKSLDALVHLEKKGLWLPSHVTNVELLQLRPELTRDPLLKEIARMILNDKGLFYAATLHGDKDIRLLIQVNNGHAYVRGFMPPVHFEPDANEPAVREIVQQFVKAHNSNNQPKLNELVSYPWCHGGRLWKVMDRKTTIELYPETNLGTYGDDALGHPGFGPKFPEKLPESILHVMRFGDHYPALLTSGEDDRKLDKFMGGYLSSTGYVVFLGKLNEGGGVALLVRIDKDTSTKKEVIKVVGTLTGLH
jgi:serine/threonine protein kinase/WD40 repeat protein